MDAVVLQGVSKKYYRHSGRSNATTLKSYLLRDMWRGRKQRTDRPVTWALRDVDVAVPAGTSLGVVGLNGSGKSTLLKVVGRILSPDAGTLSVAGRVAALIELGAGFHPELTGRENVLINGIVLGLTRAQVRERFDDIVTFAGLENWIDEPVRTYSSGMYMRLGFSVAVHSDPEVLLVDEVLAVGDAVFSQKCMERMASFRRSGKTILLASHSMETIRMMSDQVLWLHEGRVRMAGAAEEVTRGYLQLVADRAKAS